MKKLSGKQMAKLIERTQESLNWSRGEILSFVSIDWSTFMRWKRGMSNPSIDAYFRVINKVEKLGLQAGGASFEQEDIGRQENSILRRPSSRQARK